MSVQSQHVKSAKKVYAWDDYSRVILFSYFAFLVVRWPIIPQFIDIYYHFLAGWGFDKAGGYSAWDFWNYAPIGRINIYPALFHILVSFLLKLNINVLLLIKVLEIALPALFFIVLWHFVRINFSGRLAFLVLLVTFSSNSFFNSIINYLPSTLALIFGLAAFHKFFKGEMARSSIFFSLCFYTHIGNAWFFALGLLIFSFFNNEYRKPALSVFIFSLFLSLPMIFQQIRGLPFISISNVSNENYFCEFKPVEYIIALLALGFIRKADKKYRLFISFLCASLIFLFYPYRFFSAQGLLPVIFLCAFILDRIITLLKERNKLKKLFLYAFIFYFLFASPTIAMDWKNIMNYTQEKNNLYVKKEIAYKLIPFDSSLLNTVFPDKTKRPIPLLALNGEEIKGILRVIKDNTEESDIVSSSSYMVGVMAASLSGRASANRLFPEIRSSVYVDPLLVSKIFVALNDDSPELINQAIHKYNLIKIYEDNLFVIFKNTACYYKVQVAKASLSFSAIGLVFLVFSLIFCYAKRAERFLYGLSLRWPLKH